MTERMAERVNQKEEAETILKKIGGKLIGRGHGLVKLPKVLRIRDPERIGKSHMTKFD